MIGLNDLFPETPRRTTPGGNSETLPPTAPAGDPEAERRIREWLHGERLHHAVILSGGHADRRKALALEMAQSLFCDNRKVRPSGCGKCSACARLISGNHPDYVFFDSKPTDFIRIEAMREFCGDMAVPPINAPYKIGVLRHADRMNPSAANAFLKTLEEPGERRLLWLLAAQPNAFLATIRSRCLEMTIGPVSEEVGATEAQGDLSASFAEWADAGRIPEALSEVEKDREKGIAWVRYLQTELRNAAVSGKSNHQKFFSRWSGYELTTKFEKAVELEGRLRSQANYALMLEVFFKAELST